jgi:hypothetical protein
MDYESGKSRFLTEKYSLEMAVFLIWYVRVEKVLFELRMTGDMDLANPIMRNVVEIIVRTKIVVLRRNVNVVYVQQDPAVGQFDHFAQELPLRHF